MELSDGGTPGLVKELPTPPSRTSDFSLGAKGPVYTTELTMLECGCETCLQPNCYNMVSFILCNEKNLWYNHVEGPCFSLNIYRD